ncbi:hypothetical protein [Clostridium felsineum]|uniref:hypothetical protein n=1 Tax=Clostridium felsineum TaxID=36839 RepID=UPI00214DDCBB|nr:hypothetical protein [Clostridium felsineum]
MLSILMRPAIGISGLGMYQLKSIRMKLAMFSLFIMAFILIDIVTYARIKK